MASTFLLEVVTPERLVLRRQAELVIVRTMQGDVGIMAQHIPMVAALKAGVLRARGEGQEERLAISGGFLEMTGEKLTILATTAERPEEIDVDRARAAKERAERRLAQRSGELDVQRAEGALRRATVRLDVSQTKDNS